MLGKNKDIPVDRILEMQKRGSQNSEIISSLKDQGYKHEQISSAMDQARVKTELSGMEMPEREPIGEDNNVPFALLNAPSPSRNQDPEFEEGYSEQDNNFMEPQHQTRNMMSESRGLAPAPLERESYDAIEEIAESIIKEKWDDLVKNVGDIKLWKERVDIDLEGVKQELVRTQEKFEELQKALVGKIREYSEGVNSIGTEMKALERVLEKILAPLTKSVKDLQVVSEKLSKRKAPSTPRKRKTTRKKTKKKKK